MSVAVEGNTRAVASAKGVSVHTGGEAKLVLATSQLGEVAPKKGKASFMRLRPVALASGAKLLYTTDKDRQLVRASTDAPGKGTRFPWLISALASVAGSDDKVLAAYVTGTKARAMTSIVIGTPPADPKGKWAQDFEAQRPAKVAWPEELLWEKAPWSRKTRWATDPDLLFVDRSPHGYTVYDTASAVIGLIRPGADAFACTLRTPKDKASSVSATATAQGVLVATAKGNGEAVLGHFDPDGKLLGHCRFAAHVVGPMTVAGDDVLLVVDGAKLLAFAPDASAQRSETALPNDLPASQIALAATGDGSGVLLGIADRVFEVTRSGDGWSSAGFDIGVVPEASEPHQAAIEDVEVEEPDEPTGPTGKPLDLRPRIITQAPRLTLDPLQPNQAWSFAIGGTYEIVIKAVSVGGPTEHGLYVEIEGEGLANGYIAPTEVVVHRGEVPLHPKATDEEREAYEKARKARKPPKEFVGRFEVKGKKHLAHIDYLVPAGVEPNKEKKVKPKDRFLDNPEDTFLIVRLRGETKKVGSGLIFVRVGFLSSGQEGSLMRGRPVSVA